MNEDDQHHHHLMTAPGTSINHLLRHYSRNACRQMGINRHGRRCLHHLVNFGSVKTDCHGRDGNGPERTVRTKEGAEGSLMQTTQRRYRSPQKQNDLGARTLRGPESSSRCLWL